VFPALRTYPPSLVHSSGSFFFVAPPMRCLDVVWVVVSPSSSHSFGILVVGDDIVVIREVFVANGAYPALLPKLAVQKFAHLGR
jgi:hypothetical protein